MKVSICIPIYNFDVRPLVSALKNEIEREQLEAEIILIDDASELEFQQKNSALETVVEHFVILQKNIGRTKIRNLFGNYVKGDLLLFLDCDCGLTGQNFLKNYIDWFKLNNCNSVVYGGRVLPGGKIKKNQLLRWKYALQRENLPVEQRQKKPYLSFQTNNFVIRKDVFDKVKFNEDFNRYGYEDLLFAMNLKSEGILIQHIDNPVFNNDIETNRRYLEKVEESVTSLAAMVDDPEISEKISEIKLVRIYRKIKGSGTELLLRTAFSILKNPVKKKLLKGNVSLRFLDFYKLGLLLQDAKRGKIS